MFFWQSNSSMKQTWSKLFLFHWLRAMGEKDGDFFVCRFLQFNFLLGVHRGRFHCGPLVYGGVPSTIFSKSGLVFHLSRGCVDSIHQSNRGRFSARLKGPWLLRGFRRNNLRSEQHFCKGKNNSCRKKVQAKASESFKLLRHICRLNITPPDS